MQKIKILDIATTLGTTFEEVFPYLQLGIQFIKTKLTEYNESELNQIGTIQQAYMTHCSKNENEHSPSTLSVLRQKTEENKELLPVYLRLTEKIPTVFVLKIRLTEQFKDWDKFISKKDSGLLYYVNEMLKMIYYYQIKRKDRFFSFQKGYQYDPVNLFFEEFKWWLIELSKTELAEEAIKIVEGRVKYLDEIINANIFKAGKNSPTRVETIANIRETLIEKVIPLIKIAILREGSREHFNHLKSNVLSFIQHSLQFILYIFRNSDAPNIFVIDYFRTSMKGHEELEKTISAGFLKILLTSDACQYVCPQIKKKRLKN